MLETKDFIAMFVGIALLALGLLPLLNKWGIGPTWFSFSLPASIIGYIVAAGGLFLVYTSIVEITNSNSVGWLSILIALVALSIGLLPVLRSYGIGPEFFSLSFLAGFGEILFNIIFIVEGLFLIISGFMMEM